MKIMFDGENLTTDVKTKIEEIESITIIYLPEPKKYSVCFIGDGCKQDTKRYAKVLFEGLELKDISDKWRDLYPAYFYFQAPNGKYINYYPKGTRL